MIMGSYVMTRGEIATHSLFIGIFSIIALLGIYFFIKECRKPKDINTKYGSFAWFCLGVFFAGILSANLYYGIKVNNSVMDFYKIPSSVWYNFSERRMNEFKYQMEERIFNSLN